MEFDNERNSKLAHFSHKFAKNFLFLDRNHNTTPLDC